MNDDENAMELVDPATVAWAGYNRTTIAGSNTATYSLGFSANQAYAQVYVGGGIRSTNPLHNYWFTTTFVKIFQ